MKDSPGKGSATVNTSCVGSGAPAAFAGSSMDSATKAAADKLVQFAVIEDGTRVKSVAPGIVASGISGMDEDTINAWAKDLQLVGRAGKSEGVACLVTILASDDGSFLTGSVIKVDGGWGFKPYFFVYYASST